MVYNYTIEIFEDTLTIILLEEIGTAIAAGLSCGDLQESIDGIMFGVHIGLRNNIP